MTRGRLARLALSFAAVGCLGACWAHASVRVGGRGRLARDLGIVTRGTCEMDGLLARAGHACVASSGKVETSPGLDPVAAGAAFDGDVCQSYNGGPGSDGRWIGLDLGQAREVDAVLLVARHGGHATHVVDVSTDGVTFATAVVLAGEIATDQAWVIRLESPVFARWVRVTSTGGSPDSAAASWREVAILDCG